MNLIDAAEMYPVPPRPETQGRTEQYIGTWLVKKNGAKRGEISCSRPRSRGAR
ncbi:MAG: Tas protein, an NADP(H)-dependent aldo-keto reductase [uncultured Caballeronia sp.]|nr:MAG: Tas protein, an NADP(H)-dependent aldo-keto reductase [uncultured Caballeronia sp.]